MPPCPAALVTGAARGIGRATAYGLAAAGWDVIAGVRRPEDAEPLVRAAPRKITAVRLDITDAEQIKAVDAVLPTALDGGVNNAGIVVSGPVEAIAQKSFGASLK